MALLQLYNLLPVLLLLGTLSTTVIAAQKKTSAEDKAQKSLDAVLIAVQRLPNVIGKLINNASQRLSEAFSRNLKQMTVDIVQSIKQSKSNSSNVIQNSTCPAPWKLYKGMCLFFSLKKKSWLDSKRDCESKGGIILLLKNKEEHTIVNEFLKGKLKKHQNYFLGMYRKKGEKLKWIGGTNKIYYGAVIWNPRYDWFMGSTGREVLIGQRKSKVRVQPYMCRRFKKVVPVPTSTVQPEPTLCPTEWQLFKGMCLYFSLKKKSWPESRQICINKGGTLLWLQNKEEHKVVNEFMKGKLKKDKDYYLGLYREKRGEDLKWLGGSNSTYEGKALWFPRYDWFLGSAGRLDLAGRSKSNAESQPFMCRRLRNDQIPSFPMTTVQPSPCPVPWKLYKGICLFLSLEKESWPNSKQICINKGGTLLWLQNEEEHKVVNEFMKGKLKKDKDYYLGLYREKRGEDLKWLGGSNSTYESKALWFPRDDWFSGAAGRLDLAGRSKSNAESQPFMCRRLMVQ